MYVNNAQCDVYIGKGAGKKLMEELTAARESVRIVSPFISKLLITRLKELRQKGVAVELVTVEGGQGKELSEVYHILDQHVHIDGKARNRRKLLRKALCACWVLAALGMLLGGYLLVNQKVVPMAYLLVAMPVLAVMLYLIHRGFRNIRIYSYSYSPPFPLRMISREDDQGYLFNYLHSKIYIIDDRIAYLGSLNFTHSGTKYNHETRVRLTDKESVAKILEEFRHLMDEAPFPESDFSALAKRYFREPFN